MPVVILPWRPGCGHRQRAREYVAERYAAEWPSWAVVVAESGAGEWCKARALAPALRMAKDDAVIVADADVWCDGFGSAVRAVTCGAAEWAMPHRLVKRLTQEASIKYMEGADPSTLDLERQAYDGIWGGGAVIAHRDVLLETPMDPRFKGWGGEDESWAMALQCLAGPAWRGQDDLIHLWHPPQERPLGKWGSQANRALRRRYGRAGAKPEAMRSLIQEAHATLKQDDQHAVHPGSADPD